MKYIYANWKSHKNITQANIWVSAFFAKLTEGTKDSLANGSLEIGIFPPSPLLYPVREMVKGMSGIVVGAQDISRYPEGKHTGMVSASSLKDIATHALIGHAECRASGDTKSIVFEKLSRAQDASIKAILCMRSVDEYLEGATIISYEPEYAIGTGIEATPGEIRKFRDAITLKDNQAFIYGGSVNGDNIKSLLNEGVCDGFLVGTACLDPAEFANLTNQMSH